jgi:hypothetical protein
MTKRLSVGALGVLFLIAGALLITSGTSVTGGQISGVLGRIIGAVLLVAAIALGLYMAT